jgi:hypothetical protein
MPELSLFTIGAALGIICPVLGLCALLMESSKRDYLVLAALALAAFVAGAIVAANWDSGPWPFLVFAAACILLAMPRLPGVGTWLTASTAWLFRSQAAPFLLLLLGGPAVVLFWLLDTSASGPSTKETPQLHSATTELAPYEATARTDKGRPVPVYRPLGPSPPELVSEEEELVAAHLAGQVLGTAPAGSDYNCHGWIFTNGRYWIQPEDVEHILEDNGYRLVNRPRAGDLVVYRDDTGEIVHSGLVRAEAPVLVESKWGGGGRYVHTPENQVFSPRFAYFRSKREGHLLDGLDKPQRP